MSDYITNARELQVVNLTDSTGNDVAWYVDKATGEIIEALDDDKFSWREKKLKALAMSDLYARAYTLFGNVALDDCREKLKTCSTWLQYLADGKKRELHHFNACKKRLCPICAARRAKLRAGRLGKALGMVAAEHPGTQSIFLTLTMQNVDAAHFDDGMDAIIKAWGKLRRRRPFQRAVKGWFRAVEITYNAETDTYHIHMHAILVVEDDYFKPNSGLYLDQPTWVKMWRESLQVSYNPIVDVRSTYAGGKGASPRAAIEAAKYAVKDADFLREDLPMDKAAEVLATYTLGLHRRRLLAAGGWIEDALNAIGDIEADDDDLVHDDDGDGCLTEENAPTIEDYNWHWYWRIRNYLLTARYDNPACIVPPGGWGPLDMLVGLDTPGPTSDGPISYFLPEAKETDLQAPGQRSGGV